MGADEHGAWIVLCPQWMAVWTLSLGTGQASRFYLVLSVMEGTGIPSGLWK